MKKKTNNNPLMDHFNAFKIPYLTGAGFVAWFILLLILATAGQVPPYRSNAIEIGSISIAWYAVFILTGIVFAVILAVQEAKYLGIDINHLYDGILFAVPLSIVGSRIYFVLTYKDGSFSSIGEVFNISGGGLSIHGAVITAIIFVLIYTKIRKMNVFALLDILAPGFLIGQIIGRWGNFFNQEAHGGPISEGTLKNLRYVIPNFIIENMNISGTYYHPTFLYEGLWNLAGLIGLLIVRRKRLLKLGDMIGIYLMWYGFGRGLLIEPFRTDPLYIGSWRVNIVLSLTLFFLGGLIYIFSKNYFIKDLPMYLDVVNEYKQNREKDVKKK